MPNGLNADDVERQFGRVSQLQRASIGRWWDE
jgi:hypothetical protein